MMCCDMRLVVSSEATTLQDCPKSWGPPVVGGYDPQLLRGYCPGSLTVVTLTKWVLLEEGKSIPSPASVV